MAKEIGREPLQAMGLTEERAEAPPLIVTLRLDAASSRLLDRLRREYFPPERNFLAAHVTLFHHLPHSESTGARAELAQVATGELPFAVTVEGVRPLGRGVACSLASADLQRVHAALARRFADWLTPQDRQPFRPHATVQNKVTPEAAHALLAELRSGFSPWSAQALGLELWAYRGGPWEALDFFPFAREA